MEDTLRYSSDIWKELHNSQYVYKYRQPLSQSDSTSIFVARLSDHPTTPFLALKLYKKQLNSLIVLANIKGKTLQNVVELLDLKIGNPSYMIMELCQQNLRTFLNQRNQNLPTHQIMSYGIDITHGIISLKNERIIHCDIKPENLVLNKKGELKLCDLDFALSQKEAITQRIKIGTIQYMAPQILKLGKCSYKSDVWSLGIILYEMTFGTHPFPKILQKYQASERTFNECYQIIHTSIARVRKCIIQSKQTADDQNRQILIESILQCLVFESNQRTDIEEISLLHKSGDCPIRKNSWFSETTDNSQRDFSIYSNKKLMAAISNLKFLLCSLPSASLQYKKNKPLLSIIQQTIILEAEQGAMQMMNSKIKRQLENELLKSWKRMERNVQRLTTNQQKKMFGNDKLLAELKRTYNILKGLQEEDFQESNIKKLQSAQFIH